MTVFRLPDLGEGLQEAEIVAWHVTVGDRVVVDQPLLSVETDKAVVEIPAPQAGRVTKLHGAVGDIVRIGAPLVEFEEAAGSDAGAVVGTLPSQEPPAEKPKPAAKAPPRRRAVAPTPSPSPRALPAARALAHTRGVELAALSGSGPGGTITVADVEVAAATPPEGYQPLRGTRRAMAQAMTRSNAEIAATTVTDEADIDAWGTAADPMLRLVRAVTRASRREPALNAWFDGRSTSRKLSDAVDLGIAVDTPDGLIVPVLHDAAKRKGAALRKEIDRLRRGAADRSLPPAELKGPTITLSNFGMLAGRHAHLAIVPPQVAIVGAGRIEPRVVARDGEPAVHTVLPLSITFDHRAATGGEAARFLAAMIEDLEKAR
jgi:2-oxoisovalerate dehydrogenase E2 component (dihydrolipoyl transacylase)